MCCGLGTGRGSREGLADFITEFEMKRPQITHQKLPAKQREMAGVGFGTEQQLFSSQIICGGTFPLFNDGSEVWQVQTPVFVPCV